MKNKEQWKPTKFIFQKGKLRYSKKGVARSSRLVADRVAHYYDHHIKLHCRGRLIDLGCGKVPLYEAYHKYVDENVCVDWGNSLHDAVFLDHECDLTQPLPFLEAEFDTIILSDVLEHLPEPKHLFTEMHRILRPGGKCLMNVPFYYSVHEEPHDYYRYTEFALRRFSSEVGLEIIELETVGGVPEIFADLVAKNIRSLPGVGKVFAEAVQASVQLLLKTNWGKRWSDESGKKFPLGYFLVLQKPVTQQTAE